MPSAFSFAVTPRTGRPGGKIYRPPRKCHRQVVDLVRVCLVFGLPLSCQSAGEDDSDEPLLEAEQEAVLLGAAFLALGDGLFPPQWE